MVRLVALFSLIGLTLTACTSAATAIPTPLPTAVPPDDGGPSGSEPGSWVVGFQYEFPIGFLGEGPHRYAFLMRCPVVSAEDEPSEWRFFEISEQAPLQPKPIYLRLHGLSLAPLSPSYLTGNVLHPQQPIVAVVHYVGLPKPAAELAASECEVVLLFDDTGRRVLAAQEPRQP